MDGLTLHSNSSASNYINKFLTYHSELNRIPGEKASYSHGVNLFLKNITDTEYSTTVLYQQNSNASLKESINVIRKTEQDLTTRRSNRRKLQNMVHRTKRKRDESEGDEDYSLGNEEERKPHTPKRFRGELVPKYSGMLGVAPDIWKTMTDEHMTFIQDWNAKVKHDEDPKSLPVPKGIIIKTRARRIADPERPTIKQEPQLEDNKGEDKIDDEPNNRKRKSIGFLIDSGDENESGIKPKIESK